MDAATTSRQTFGLRGSNRKLSDYCSIFAEKTNRIGRNVGSFVQSHAFWGRRSAEDSGNLTHRSNGDVIRSDYRLPNPLERRSEPRPEARHRYGPLETDRRDRCVYSKNAYLHERGSYANGDAAMQHRRVRQRDYTDLYQDDSSVWGRDSSDLNGCKPILRNGISHARGEKLYSSTLPRRSRTINFRDQLPSNSLESRRGYPKSLQNLSDLDDAARDHRAVASSFLSSNGRGWRDDRIDDAYRRRRYREDQLEDDYLRLYRNLSRLDKYPQSGRYEPGQVHYERECRTFGKDTVAFIYYKTCYL